MTTNRVSLLIVLPTALAVGCGTDKDCSGDECASSNTECTSADCIDPGEFAATIRSVAPYGWAGDHGAYPASESGLDYFCQDAIECDIGVEDYGNWRVAITGDTFMCVPQIQLVEERDAGTTVSVSDAWLGEGICGLAPNGEYSGWNVDVDIADANGFDQIWIWLATWAAVVSNNEFFYENDEYLLEGTIADDLSSISFHRVLETGETEQTIYLE